jgi:general secretion pathway protein J
MTPCRDRPHEVGFTLLELLVVLVVLGLLMVGLVQGVRAGLQLWHAQARRVGEVAELDAAARILRTLLSGIAVPPPGAAAGGAAAATPVKGTSARLDFVGDLPTGLGTTRRADMSLDLEEGRLLLIWIPRRHELATGPPAAPVKTELIAGVRRLEIAYWGSPGPDRPAGWQESWEGPELPDLLRLRLAFAKGDPRRWPDLVVAPRL